jgi:hypothetical protein
VLIRTMFLVPIFLIETGCKYSTVKFSSLAWVGDCMARPSFLRPIKAPLKHILLFSWLVICISPGLRRLTDTVCCVQAVGSGHDVLIADSPPLMGIRSCKGIQRLPL